MKITTENALTEYPKVREGMPEIIEKTFQKLPQMMKFYGRNEQITKTVDLWIEKVNMELDKRGESKPAEPKKDPKPAPKKEEKKKESKYKVGDWVVVKMTDGSESDPVLIAELAETPDGRVTYTADGGDFDFFEESIIRKTKEPKPKKETKPKQRPKPKFKKGDKVHCAIYTDDALNRENVFEILSMNFENGEYVYYVTGDGQHYVKEHLITKAKETNAKSSKQKKDPEPFKGEYVDVIPDEVKLIKRYLWMNGRTMAEIKRHKSNNPNTLLNAIQKAITEKRIRKTSPYADEIMAIQKTLVQICNGDKNFTSGKFESKNADALKAIVDKYKVSDYRKVSNAYIKNQEKANKKKEAESLLKRMQDIKVDDDYKEEFEEMKKAVKAVVDGKADKIDATERQLRGLYGIINKYEKKGKLQGLGSIESDNQGVVNSKDLLNARFSRMGFAGRWLSLIGDPCEGFKMMVYGSAGNGKSTFCLLFAKYLSENLNKKVLYIASEEKFGYTLKEKIERLNVANDNFYIAEKIPYDLSDYDVVFFDSVNDLGIDPQELNEIASQGISTVAIFQCTKDGDYRGGSEFKHDSDVVIKVENMMAKIDTKNRFGGIVGNEFAVR